MSRNHLANQTPDVTAEACAWIAQLETGDLTPADVDAFREWMQRSPRHTTEVRRLARLSAELNVLSGLEPALREAAERYRPVTRGRSGRTLFASLRPGALVALASVLIVAVMVLFKGLYLPWLPSAFETPVGGYAERQLPDGSTVKLNTDSRIDIAFGKQQRQVYLRRGEVFFDVAHNPERPFVVHAYGKSIRALGTAFAVRLDSDDLRVTVTEGRVELKEIPVVGHDPQPAPTIDATEALQTASATSKTSSPMRAILEAGQSLIISQQVPSPKINRVTGDQIRRSLAWREGVFDFSETPLDEVVREFGRYTTLSVEIADPALRDRKFSGIFPTDNIEPLLDALQSGYGIEVTYVNANTVRLGRVPQS